MQASFLLGAASFLAEKVSSTRFPELLCVRLLLGKQELSVVTLFSKARKACAEFLQCALDLSRQAVAWDHRSTRQSDLLYLAVQLSSVKLPLLQVTVKHFVQSFYLLDAGHENWAGHQGRV